MGLNGIYSGPVRREPKEKLCSRARLQSFHASHLTTIFSTQLMSDMEPVPGKFHLPLRTWAFIDSRGCSPPKNSPPSNPWWPARASRPARRAPNPETLSTSATWSNSGLAPTRTGKRVYFWSARCARMAASAVLCCGLIGVDIARRGIRTDPTRSFALAEQSFRDPNGPSGAPATLHFALDASGEKVGSEHLIRYRNLSPTVPTDCWLAGFWPDNEHHAAPCRSP
jgi:hypothetical protein